MNSYIATFYTHLSAMRSHQKLRTAGLTAKLMPVPRALSASCGTCVSYLADEPHEELLDSDAEQLALRTEDGFRILKHFS